MVKHIKLFSNLYRLSLKLKCWGVGTLLIRVSVLGNEADENRNDVLSFDSKK